MDFLNLKVMGDLEKTDDRTKEQITEATAQMIIH